jgi:AcrR family transcriptional regulator
LKKRTTLTRDDWLAGAMELLREQGIGGVRILTLAQRMGVSRGSFYWHFRDHADLLEGMLEWWEREMTDNVIRHAETASGQAPRRLLALGEYILGSRLTGYDMAVRSWAQADKTAITVFRRVMQKRLVYVPRRRPSRRGLSLDTVRRSSCWRLWRQGRTVTTGRHRDIWPGRRTTSWVISTSP